MEVRGGKKQRIIITIKMMRKIIFLLLFGGQWLMASGQQGEVGGQRSEVYNAGKMPTLQVAGGTPALQEAVQEATLDSCRRWARENYPLVEQYGLVKQSAEYSVENASRGWLPQVRLTAQATWQTDAARFPDQMNTMLATMGTEIEGMRQDQYKVVVDVQQYLWDGGRSAAEKQMAQAQAQADGLTADVDFYALEGRVDNLFFGILLLERQIALTEMRISLLEENLRRCRVMAENDMLMQSDVDAVEVELLTAGQRREELQGSRDAYREMLSLLTGSELLLPGPFQVLRKLAAMMTTGAFWSSVALSLLRILGGILAALVLGVLLAVLTERSSLAKALFSPLMLLVRSTPVASFIILALIWLGRDILPLFISALMVLPVVWANVSAGIAGRDVQLLEMAKVYGLSRGRIFRRITVPSVLPHFRAALSSALGLGWKAGIAAEVLTVPKRAIGRMIYESKLYLETTELFAWTLTVILLSFVIERLLLRLVLLPGSGRRTGIPGIPPEAQNASARKEGPNRA